jgi:CHAT domain-containing protein
VHLATHGLFREGAPYSAELTLAGEASLTIPDLTGLDTPTELVVLSACDSGRGRATAAGDLIGLSRALIATGTRELVVSLWPVNDQFACLTMVAFHEQLAAQVPVSVALTKAQHRIRALTHVEAYAWYQSLSGSMEPSDLHRARSNRDRGEETKASPVFNDPSHPFFWAPFIHIGTS